jgi:hypothetical protein
MVLKNKKGDVPITILVIGVFAVCTIALLSFSYSIISFNKSFDTLNVMESINIGIEKNPSQNYYEEITKEEFSLNLDFEFFKKVVIFSVEYFGD